MKEIGEKLRETREEMGISIDEVAEDLKVSKSQIEDSEEGNIKAFKDIYSLKFFIRDYSKYLGLDYDKMVDEFNEYLFDYTSKLSIDEIRKASEDDKKKKKKVEKISSPYTIEKKQKNMTIPIIAIVVVLLGAVVAGYVIWKNNNTDKNVNNVIG